MGLPCVHTAALEQREYHATDFQRSSWPAFSDVHFYCKSENSASAAVPDRVSRA